MKDKKTRLKRVDDVRIAAIVAIAFLGMLAAGRGKTLFFIVELLVLAVFLLLEFTMNRCPHCDRYLDRNRGRFCQHCGQPIREEDPNT